jgi:DNA-binding transcriptional LysR family regulator
MLSKPTYPKTIVEPEIELSARLRGWLATDTVNLIVVPQAAASERFVSIPVGTVENGWMCSPSLHSGKATMPIADIAQLRLLLQGIFSGTA